MPLTRGEHRLKAFGGIHTGENNWNSIWRQFEKDNPKPLAEDIIDQLEQMRSTFGI